MNPKPNILTKKNIVGEIAKYLFDISQVGVSLRGRTGLPLLEALKREHLDSGRYPGVTLFEAANRIMTDLVILRGVAGMMNSTLFSFFDEYTVEYGSENNNGFDLRANHGECQLIGEAFNVAPTFFPVKRNSAMKKLRDTSQASTHRILMYNSDAISKSYKPRHIKGWYHVVVDINTGQVDIGTN
jgi:hypothetical protein